MAENWRERGRGLYYFSRGQLVVLAVGFIVTSVVVFFLGILIGQGIEEGKLLKKEEPLVKIPLRPLPKGAGGTPGAPAKEEMTFYDTLAKAPTGAQAKRGKPTKEGKPVQKSPGTERARAESGRREGAWAVQVNAFPHEGDAKRLARKLKDKGYDAYVVSTEVKGRTWHRVRVGRLETRAQAKELQEDLKTKEKFTKAITVSR